MDRLTRDHRNVLLIATTNFPEALDEAVLSRADHIEEIGLPDAAARRDIIADTLDSISSVWHERARLRGARRTPRARPPTGSTAAASARQFSRRWPLTSRRRKDPNRSTAAQIEAALREASGPEGNDEMRVRRDISSIPHRSAGETWQRIIDLVTGRRFEGRAANSSAPLA